MAEAPEPQPSTWLSQRERGSRWLIRATFRLATLIGRLPMRLPVVLVAMWYRLFDRTAVRASKDYLTRIHGEAPGFWRVYGHFRRFVQVTLDRVFMATGKTRAFEFSAVGHERLLAQLETGKGAILLGAHLGSYEAMRFRSVGTQVPIWILGHFENAAQINALLEELDPGNAAKVVHVGGDPVAVAVQVRQKVMAGDLVAVLGDRVGLDDRAVVVDFLGAPAPFAGGPFLLAHSMGCPVYFVCGLYREPNHYELHCEPLFDQVRLPRRSRDAALREYVVKYAAVLERYCRLAPDNWFNYFDFWAAPPAAPDTKDGGT